MHPAFEPVVDSEKWLREFLAANDCPGYDTVMDVIRAGRSLDGHSIDEDYFHFDGIDAHSEIPAEFWTHVEAVTGVKQTKKPSYFSCGC